MEGNMSSIFSEVTVWINDKGGPLLARGTFVVAGAVKVNFSYLSSAKGPFVSLPQEVSEKDGKKVYWPHAKLISKSAIEELNKLVAAEFENVKSTGGTRSARTDTVDVKPAQSVDRLPF
jgi:hypothetical protein